MKSHPLQSATSLPRAPRDDAHTRMTKYFAMMTIRVVCFVLMVLIQPYGWYTWLLAVGAIVLPYLAVVVANVAASPSGRAVPPERALGTGRPAPQAAETDVIRIRESTHTQEEP